MLDGVVDIPLLGQTPSGDSARGREPVDRPCRFVMGPENRLAEAAVQSLLDVEHHHAGPVVLQGRTGTGKSHLALGLVAAWKASFPGRPAVYAAAIDFARELADAVETKTVDEFGTRYRLASLFVLDDIDYLEDKLFAQEELLRTFDSVIDSGGRVLVTARADSVQLLGFVPALESRLAAGLTVEVMPPGSAARLTILKRLAEARSIELSDATAEVLAHEFCVTVPELFGALNELEMSARLNGRPIDVEAVRVYIQERENGKMPSLHQIALKTARHFSLKLSELRSPSRRRAVVAARGVAMYLARTLTPNSLEKIGTYFGGRDHTTVAYGCQKTERLLDEELPIRRAVDRLREELKVA